MIVYYLHYVISQQTMIPYVPIVLTIYKINIYIAHRKRDKNKNKKP